MTTVSKPKRRPPKAATTVLLRRYRFMGWRTGGPHGMVSRATRGSQTRVFSNDIMVGSERWQSGRSHPPRKRAYLDGYREFESPPLRQPIQMPVFGHAGLMPAPRTLCFWRPRG